jgi:voltage-gated potassium channel Kch
MLVLFLTVTVFVLPPFMGEGRPVLSIIFDISFSLMLLTGLTAITRTRMIVAGGSGIVLVALAGRWLARTMPGAGLETFNIVMSILSTLLLCALVVRQVFREGPITVHRILGAVAVYLLLGVAWGFTYSLLALLQPGSFTISSPVVPGKLADSEFLYFSFVTLTTVGFGDITAIHPVGRSLVMLEALTGQLFPAILIARLVSMELVSRER